MCESHTKRDLHDAPRDVRDRLGEALRKHHGWANRGWRRTAKKEREFWMLRADNLVVEAASCGLKIVEDDNG